MGLFSGLFDSVDDSDDATSMFGITGDDSGDDSGSSQAPQSSGLSNSQTAALGKAAIAGTGLLLGGSSSSQVQAGTMKNLKFDESIESSLGKGVIPLAGKIQDQVSPHTEDNFKSSKSVDADTLDAEWNGRLATYANMVRNSRYQ